MEQHVAHLCEVRMFYDTVNHMITTALLAGIRRWGAPEHPHWLRAIIHRHFYHYNVKTVVPLIMAAQDEGIGLHEVWAEPGTSIDEMMTWFDDRIRETPHQRIAGLDLFRVAVVACPESLWTSDDPIDFPPSAFLADWHGPRTAWIAEGRAVITSTLHHIPDHQGLYLVVNGVSAAIRAALPTL